MRRAARIECAGIRGHSETRRKFGVQPQEVIKLERYLRTLFQLPSIQVRQRPQKDDSAEVYIGEEFVGVLFRDEDDDDLSYAFQMAILEYDLKD
jgi:hypothetical protein